MADDFDLVKISELPAATAPGEYDVLAGVQSGDTKQFSFATLLTWMQQAITASAIGAVPQTRKINNHALTSDITLTASDVGAIPTSAKGANGGVAELDGSGKVPSAQLPPIASTAADVTYDNTQSGMTADDVQEAIDELAAGGSASGKADQTTVAPVESSTTATEAHPLGSVFYLSGVLYRALSDIAIGDTINTASGGNATQTTIAHNFKRTVTLTAAQYAQLSAAEKAADIVYIVTDDNTIAAANVSYDNSASGLTASTAQAAVDELADRFSIAVCPTGSSANPTTYSVTFETSHSYMVYIGRLTSQFVGYFVIVQANGTVNLNTFASSGSGYFSVSTASKTITVTSMTSGVVVVWIDLGKP